MNVQNAGRVPLLKGKAPGYFVVFLRTDGKTQEEEETVHIESMSNLYVANVDSFLKTFAN